MSSQQQQWLKPRHKQLIPRQQNQPQDRQPFQRQLQQQHRQLIQQQHRQPFRYQNNQRLVCCALFINTFVKYVRIDWIFPKWYVEINLFINNTGLVSLKCLILYSSEPAVCDDWIAGKQVEYIVTESTVCLLPVSVWYNQNERKYRLIFSCSIYKSRSNGISFS